MTTNRSTVGLKTPPPLHGSAQVDYFHLTLGEGYHWGMVRGIWSSVADLAVAQAQDILGLGLSSRMNTPSTLGGNWCWACPARRIQPLAG